MKLSFMTRGLPSAATLATVCLLKAGVPALEAADNWSVVSPSTRLKMVVELADPAARRAGQPCLSYRVEEGTEGFRTAVLLDSPLGLVLQGHDLSSQLRFVSANGPNRVEDRYTMPHGKRSDCQNTANHLTLVFQNEAGQSLEMDLRVYDDGVAFRYRVPGTNTAPQTLEAESTGFALPKNARLWMHPSDKVGTYSPAYETYYESEIPLGTPGAHGTGWSFPVLYRTHDTSHWVLLTEADVASSFCASRLSNAGPGGVYQVRFPDPAEGNHTGSVKPSSVLPWVMPWRVVMVGRSLGTIVESTLVTDVSTPAQLTDTDWVRPGRVAWSWWSDPPSPQDGKKQMKFIDLAARMGWEYILVDANWTIIDDGTIFDVLRHARKKNVGVLLWYNSGGPHNVVTEKPRDSLTYPPVRQFEFELLQKWGVKGVKVDFFQSDKQEVIKLYHDILRDAAKYKIMVNFHGCTLPRGWSRTWPHLMSMEAIRGEECYIFDKEFPERAPVQNTISPFTRNVVGPTDYTPVAFSDNKYPHRTTSGHELALSVLFESGWLHFADKAAAYLDLPSAPRNFLKTVPVAWDDTRFVAGYPGKFVILARRKGDTWYLAGVNARNERCTEQLQFGPWLGSGPRELTIITDGEKPRSFATERKSWKPGQELSMPMAPYGGFVATIPKTN